MHSCINSRFDTLVVLTCYCLRFYGCAARLLIELFDCLWLMLMRGRASREGLDLADPEPLPWPWAMREHSSMPEACLKHHFKNKKNVYINDCNMFEFNQFLRSVTGLMVLSVNLQPACRKLPSLGVLRSVNGLMSTDERFGPATCRPPTASCPPYAFTVRPLALMVLIG